MSSQDNSYSSANEEIVRSLDAIKARAEAATPEPWGAGRVYDDLYEVELPDVPKAEDSHFAVGELENRFLHADAHFIAAARTDVPALVAAAEAVLELHEPTESSRHAFTYCCECSDVEVGFSVLYPCPTVTAIQSALGDQ